MTLTFLYNLSYTRLLELCEEFLMPEPIGLMSITQLIHDLIEWCHLQGQLDHLSARAVEYYQYLLYRNGQNIPRDMVRK